MVAPTNKVCVITNYRCGYLCVCVCKNSQNPKPKRKFHQALTKEKISPTLNQRENFPNPKLKEKISLTLTITLTLKPNPKS